MPSTKANTVPHTPDWLHEVKYDGYRLRLEREGEQVRLFTQPSSLVQTQYGNPSAAA